MKTFAPVLGLAVAMMAANAHATNSPIELKTALNTIMMQLPGEYDSEPQRFFEAEYKTPKDQQHQRVYRAFTKIDAPDVGQHVVVATVHASDKYSKFDEAEFQVWTLSVDEPRQVVRMSPRKFAEPAKYAAIATDPAKMKGLMASELVPAKGAAGSDILWRLHGTQLLGRTDPGTCNTRMTRLQTNASFDWEWLLNDSELWITFAGRDPAGKLIMGRADQTHWRLSKARSFECFLAYRPNGGKEQVQNGFVMHDRGDVRRFDLTDGKSKPRPVFMELIRGTWPSNSGRNYLVLLRLQVYEGTPDAAPDTWKLIGNATGNDDTDRAGFTTQDLSGRCKLAQAASAPM